MLKSPFFQFVKKAFIVMFVIVCLFGIWGTFFPGNEAQKETQDKQTNAPVWKTYENKTYGYTVQYPDSLTLSEENPTTTVFQKKEKSYRNASFPSLYVSVIPQKYTGNQKDIYNFMSKDIIDRFFLMNDADSQLIEPQADPTYWTYTKLATIPVAGVDAIVIQNDAVWDGEEGLRNRRILLKKNGTTYILGSYYQTQEELTLLQRFVESFILVTK